MSLLASVLTSRTLRGAAISLGAWLTKAAIVRLVAVSGFELVTEARVLLYQGLDLAMVGGALLFLAGMRRVLWEIQQGAPAPTVTVSVPSPMPAGTTPAATTVTVAPSAEPKP